MNHPLHDHPNPSTTPTYHHHHYHHHFSPTPPLIKPYSTPNFHLAPSRSPRPLPPTALLTSDLPQSVHPPFDPSVRHLQSPHSHSSLKQLSKAIKKSRSIFNRFLKRNRNNPPDVSSSSNNLPVSVDLDPPLPLQFSPSNSSSSNLPPWSACQLDQHQFLPHSPYLDGFSAGSLSPAELASPNPRLSATSSGEISFRLAPHLDQSASSSPRPQSQLNWLARLSRPRTTMGLAWSDRNSVHTALTSIAGRSPSSAPCPSSGSSGPRRYCASPSPNHARPVFGITVKEALHLSSQEYHGACGKVMVPTIVYKCGERLKCAKGMKSRGIFRINGNIKRMRELESIFMNPELGYGTDFDIADPRPWVDPHVSDERPQPEFELDPQVEPYFSIHDVAGVLRRYLWALPEPLVPYEMTTELILVWRKFHRSQEGDTRLLMIQEFEQVFKQRMQREELDLLNYLLELLGLFSIRSEDNLMNSKNLAIVFQPGIMPIPISEEDQLSRQHQHSRQVPHPCPKSRARERMSQQHLQHNLVDFQQRSSLQVADGVGLDDYLGQIDEVQEILRLLIDRSASITHNPHDSHIPAREPNNDVFLKPQPFDRAQQDQIAGLGDDGG